MNKPKMRMEIEKILMRLNVYVVEDPKYMLNHPQAVEQILKLFSNTVDQIIGEDEKVANTLAINPYVAKMLSRKARNNFRAEQRTRKKFILSDNEGELIK